MSRGFSVYLCLLFALPSSALHAGGHRHHAPSPQYGASVAGPVFGWGYRSGRGGYTGLNDFNGLPYYGYGYAYDPYRHGSFRAPDLLNEPYFRAQHKFDSQFPGRYSGRPRLQLRNSVPVHSYP